MVKNLLANVGEPGSIPGSVRSPGEGNGSQLQHPCLENPTEREPSGLQSMGLQRVGHDSVTKQACMQKVQWRKKNPKVVINTGFHNEEQRE